MPIRPSITRPILNIGLRDMSQDLRDRLEALESEKKRLSVALELVQDKIAITEQMLALETAESVVPAKPSLPRLKPSKPLQDIHSMVRGLLLKGVTNKDEIIEAVERKGHEKPGRSVNAALMTFKRYGHVDPQGPDGREFVLTDTGREALKREEGS